MSIDDLLNNLKITQQTFRSLIITSNFSNTVDTISWSKYASGIYKNIYAKEYENIIRNRQYSFLLAKGKGCIQYYYNFKNNVLNKAKLAYYPYPVELKEEVNDVESYLDDTNDPLLQEYYYDIWNMLNYQFELDFPDDDLQRLAKEAKDRGNDESIVNLMYAKFDSKYKLTNSSHLRIDYDINVNTHHKCEIQIGALNNVRLPMNKLIYPFTFFDFIAKNIFKTEYIAINAKEGFDASFATSKNGSFDINPFVEENLFLNHI